VIEGNRILGLVILGGTLTEPVYQPTGAWQRALNGVDLTKDQNLGKKIAAGALGITAGSARFVDNELAGVTLGDEQLQGVIALAEGKAIPDLAGVYRDIVVSGNRLAGFATFLLAETVLLGSNSFYTPLAVPKRDGRYLPLSSAYAAAKWFTATGNIGNFTPGPSDQPSCLLIVGAPEDHAVGAANLNFSTRPKL
jgi:hypothetical protein